MNSNNNQNRPPVRRSSYNKRSRVTESALKGALLGLVAFTLLVVIVFAFVAVNRFAGNGLPLPFGSTSESESAAVSTIPSDTTVAPQGSDTTVAGSPDTTETVTQSPTETTAPVTEAPVPPTPAEKRLSLIACGDNIVHDAVREDAKKRATSENPNFNFYDMYSGVSSLISKADVSFINMEGCVAGAALGYLGYPNFNAPNEIAEAFVKLGFDVVNIANNHTLDYGETGYVNTIKYFDTLPFITIGGYTKDNYDDIRIFEKNGIKVAFLSYTNIMNYDPATWLPRDLPASSEYIIPFAEDAVITRQIQKAVTVADFVVVSMHWGVEDQFSPDSEQQRLAKLCADLGAHVVIGHHSHTVQPASWIEGRNGNKTFVAYSLGNFISTMHYSQNMAGVMLSLEFAIDENGNKTVESPRLIPTVCHYSLNRDALQIYRMSEYSQALAAKHGSTLQNAFSYDILKKYITDTISAEFIEW